MLIKLNSLENDKYPFPDTTESNGMSENLHGHFVIQFLSQIIWSLKTDKHKKLPSMIAIHTPQQ